MPPFALFRAAFEEFSRMKFRSPIPQSRIRPPTDATERDREGSVVQCNTAEEPEPREGGEERSCRECAAQSLTAALVARLLPAKSWGSGKVLLMKVWTNFSSVSANCSLWGL